METRIAELAALALVVACTLQGAHRGLLLKVYSLVRIVLILILSRILFPMLLPLFPVELAAREGIALLATLATTAISLHVLARLLRIVDHVPVIKTLNKLGGAALGFVAGLLLLWIALLLIVSLRELEWCYQVYFYVRQSETLMQFYQSNPLTIMPDLMGLPGIM